MRAWKIGALLAAGVAVGCAAGSPKTTAQSTEPPPSGPNGSPFSDRHVPDSGFSLPLVIDRADLRLGTTVQFGRIPTTADLNDIQRFPSVTHIVVSLPAWPATFEPLQSLTQLPEQCDLIAVLPGYPPSREAAEAWNYVNARLRLVVVVPGPPPNSTVANDLNAMRYLERVVAQMDEPSRSGFERLQRPLSFRRIME